MEEKRREAVVRSGSIRSGALSLSLEAFRGQAERRHGEDLHHGMARRPRLVGLRRGAHRRLHVSAGAAAGEADYEDSTGRESDAWRYLNSRCKMLRIYLRLSPLQGSTSVMKQVLGTPYSEHLIFKGVTARRHEVCAVRVPPGEVLLSIGHKEKGKRDAWHVQVGMGNDCFSVEWRIDEGVFSLLERMVWKYDQVFGAEGQRFKVNYGNEELDRGWWTQSLYDLQAVHDVYLQKKDAKKDADMGKVVPESGAKEAIYRYKLAESIKYLRSL